MLFLVCFSNRSFRGYNVFVCSFKRFSDVFVVFGRKREIVKTSTACAGEFDFEGLAGFGFIDFSYFEGFVFLLALGMDF